MTTIVRTPTKDQPKLFEAVIQEMQQDLADGIAWLEHVFGKAERTVREYVSRRDYNDNKLHEEEYIMPGLYVGGGKYEDLEPDAPDWKSYAFFYMNEPQQLSAYALSQPYYHLQGEVNLIVWGDIRDIEAADDRNIDSIKSELLQVLGSMRLSTGHVTWKKIYEQDPQVFEAYSFSDASGKLTMWPYFAFRFVGDISCDSGCSL